MTRQLVGITLIALMHIVCYAIMTERKYSVKKTVSIYLVFFAKTKKSNKSQVNLIT